jgi:glutamate racemase
MSSQNKKIQTLGVFDSGVGGLTVLQELIKLPIPQFLYFADTANLPYGEKTKEQIEQLTLRAVSFLVNSGADAVVLACHTASANAYDVVRSHFPNLPIFDVVNPVVMQALEKTVNNRIGIIGTQATITSAIHQAKIISHTPHAVVINQACPQFVPLIEARLTNKKALHAAIDEYVTPLIKQDIDTLIIGCTHYEIIKEEIQYKVGNDMNIISVPALMHAQLQNHIFGTAATQAIRYHITGDVDKFRHNALTLLDLVIDSDKLVHITKAVIESQHFSIAI